MAAARHSLIAGSVLAVGILTLIVVSACAAVPLWIVQSHFGLSAPFWAWLLGCFGVRQLLPAAQAVKK